MRRAGPFSAMLSPLSAPSSGGREGAKGEEEDARCRLVSIRNAGRPKKGEVGGRALEKGDNGRTDGETESRAVWPTAVVACTHSYTQDGRDR